MAKTPRDHKRGFENAPIQLVEYGDYECSFCGHAFPLIKRLKAAIKKDLVFIYRNFPLDDIHPNAMPAARAAEAAALQGKFWEMHDALFMNQEDLAEDALLRYAAELDLDLERLQGDMAGAEIKEKIMRDIELGLKSDVHGTPTLFVNGVRYEGDRDYEELVAVFNEVLQAERKKAG